jgi:hypothetical protein
MLSPRSRGVAQVVSAPVWGTGGRRFESCLPDHKSEIRITYHGAGLGAADVGLTAQLTAKPVRLRVRVGPFLRWLAAPDGGSERY